MKHLYIFLILIAFFAPSSFAQNSDTKKADQLYERLQYTDAIDAYEKLLKQGKGNRFVFERLANSYYYINDTKKAETYYKRVAKGRNVAPEVLYNYAQSLKANGKFSDYNDAMQQFAEAAPNDSRAKEFLKNPNYVPQIVNGDPAYNAKGLDLINTAYSEFGGTMSGKDFYFSSARNTTRKTYGWDEQPFLDIYNAQEVGGTLKNATLLKGEVNTKYHEGNVAISPDGKRMYFDRNDYYKGDYDKSSNGINQINLYYAELVDTEWKDIQSVAFNNDEYSTGHPALSPDGSTLYFVSDMPGGKGLSDIYKVSVSTEGVLGTPQRLDDTINTEGKEVFPYMDSNGTLYFSSDGHLGIGLLDVFYTEATANGFGDVKNMGKGVNSSDDDFAIRFNPETKTGFVSSNRQGGKGSDDIYAITEVERPCQVTINVHVTDEYTKKPIAGAAVALYDTNENKLTSGITDANGMATLLAACDIAHIVQGTATDYESNAEEVDAANDTEITANLMLRPIEAIIQDGTIVLNPIYFDLDKHNIKPQAAFELDKLVAVMKKYPKLKIKVESHTDERASDAYNLELSNRRAQSTVQYVISKGIDGNRISGEGKGENFRAVKCSPCSEAQHQKNRRSEFIITNR
jgi:outer membrane protein OmpA-like peptidoglycan-associated protein/tetratricopeptide (TPR) repeat protein